MTSSRCRAIVDLNKAADLELPEDAGTQIVGGVGGESLDKDHEQIGH
jgi:hypothetical protein